MDQTVKQKINKLMDQHQVGTLATIRDQKPFTRFMTFSHEDLTLYTASDKHTHKVEDINQNPSVHILLGNKDISFDHSYMEIEAKAEITDEVSLKEKCWNNHLHEWLEGPNDPNYVVLKLTPEKVRFFEEAGSNPEEFTL
ncbi:pyridoxamine 5'-phosphate oxidase family protein [Bacillus salitolerans]|uniref:Pyridoxamine 5'-phosphate oxidase family protein n=1 Tax=Bacillus salitolerans TaxID=1437434 RepID=A0ABW4LS85_9BACI